MLNVPNRPIKRHAVKPKRLSAAADQPLAHQALTLLFPRVRRYLLICRKKRAVSKYLAVDLAESHRYWSFGVAVRALNQVARNTVYCSDRKRSRRRRSVMLRQRGEA